MYERIVQTERYIFNGDRTGKIIALGESNFTWRYDDKDELYWLSIHNIP